MRTFPLPGLGHKPQYKNNLRLCVWALSRTSQDRSTSWPQTHLSCHPTLTFLEFFHSVPTPQEMCVLYWSLSDAQTSPSAPSLCSLYP